jgi:hypothetical protein
LARDNLQTYASEFTFVKFVIENEKCLESQQIQRLFESVKLKSIIEQSGLSIRAALSERLRKVFEPSEDTLEKLSELELLFMCYEKLGLQSLFEETFVEELLRRLVKRCGNSAIMRDLVDVTKEILQGELEWLAFLGKYSCEAQLVAAVSRCIGELLVKGMLARGELFPINTLDAFSENYQMFYSLVENVFRGNSVPESLQVAMKKRENLLYKAYVVNVIKKLESSLMQLENFILQYERVIQGPALGRRSRSTASRSRRRGCSSSSTSSSSGT